MEIKMPEFFDSKSAKVGKISVKVGDTVAAWSELMQIETGKGSEAVKTKKAGVVTELNAEEGSEYASGTVLAVISEEVPAEKKEEKKEEPSEILELKMPEFFDSKSAKVGKINLRVGDAVAAWGEVMQIETGKGSEAVKSKKAGVIASLNVEEGGEYESGTVLATVLAGGTAKPAERKEETGSETLEIKMPEFFDSKSAKVGKISVKVGDTVAAWSELMQIETGKGSEAVKTKKAGVVTELNAEEGSEYASGTVLAVLNIGATAAKPEQTAAAKEAEGSAEADILILGAGTGGYMAAIMAAKKGRKVTIVEENRLGGTCLNVGCIPTKTLIASSSVYKRIMDAKEFGIQVEGTVTPDMNGIIDRKQKVVDKLVGGIDYLMKKNKVEVVKGTARFLDNSHVEVTRNKKVTYTFKECLIATGSVVSIPPIPGVDGKNIIDSTGALSLRELPKSVTIVGGGVIGMEFAFLYRNLGAEVTVVEFLPKLLATLDEDVSKMIETIAVEKGIRVELGAKVTGFADTIENRVVTMFEKDGAVNYATSDKVLVAVGRKANIAGLGLENTSIELNEKGRGIKVDDYMRTSVEHIYAVGDVNNRIQLAHAAAEQGILAVRNMLGESEAFDITMVPSVIFTDPEIATVGINEDEAKKRGIAYRTGTFHYSSNGKALTMAETEGFVRLLKDENDVIIGGTIIGADASALIATVTVCVANRMKDSDLDRTVFAHPTTAEVIHEAAMDLSIGAFNE